MDKNLLQNLKDWRVKTARRENVELFRVISNQALEEIAEKKPQKKSELLEVKGVKEKKYAKYGEEILAMVRGEGDDLTPKPHPDPLLIKEREDKVFEVSEYLDIINNKITNLEARVRGEVSSVKFWPSGISFDIKDKKDESLLKCFMWKNDYAISGVDLKDGTEILVWGYPEMRKQWGQLNFQTKLIELVGEGILKKAYEELKRKLETEGLFSLDRKRILPSFVKKIGLITSSRGEAIVDFRSNLGKYGIEIKFFDVRVEGKQAIFELINAVKWFNENMPSLDVIAIVKGGGSLESFQAFNTEALVREVANSKIPTICGVGHERDITLTALAADKMVSTPTAVAIELNKSWDEAIHGVESGEKYILNAFANILAENKNNILETERILAGQLSEIFERFRRAREKLKNNLVKIKMTIDYEKNYLANTSKKLVSGYVRLFSEFKNLLKSLAEKIVLHNPERQLKLGYSLVSFNSKIIRSVKDIEIGDEVDMKLSDGELKSKIISKKL